MEKEEQKISGFVVLSSTTVWASSILFYVLVVLHMYIKKTSIPVVVTPRLFASRVLYSPSPRCRVCVCVCVSSRHDLPPLKAATTDAALGGRVGSASLLNMFLTGGTQTGNAAPTKPKAHDHTTIGSLCKNVVQNPAMSFSSGVCACACVCVCACALLLFSIERFERKTKEEERRKEERESVLKTFVQE